MLLFLAWSGITRHDFWAPLTVQNKLRSNENPYDRLVHLAHQMVGNDAFKTGLHVPFIIVFFVLLVIVARRLPLSYAAFAAVVLLLTLSADNLNSLERYGLNAFPLAIGLALFSRRDERIEWVAIALGAVTCTALSALALLGLVRALGRAPARLPRAPRAGSPRCRPCGSWPGRVLHESTTPRPSRVRKKVVSGPSCW